MKLLPVKAVWFRQITNADFFNIEKTPGTTSGGGGMTYIDLPKAARDPLFEFIGRKTPGPTGPFPPIDLPDVRAIGNPTASGSLRMSHNREGDIRYRVENQNRHMQGSQRHPAWMPTMGFPQANGPVNSAATAQPYINDGLRIFLVQTTSGDVFAGFAEGKSLPAGWPRALDPMFDGDPGGCIFPNASVGFEIDDIVRRVLDAWQRGRTNVLLYGPPGTGKTHAMNSLWQLLRSEVAPDSIFLDPDSYLCPFQAAQDVLPIPLPVERDWVTFHQSYTYEDFVIGLRPDPTPQGISLVPRVGRMLDLAIGVDQRGDGSAVLMIDEINRGNVARIFGEFITFMDPDYRAALPGSDDNEMKLPVPLPSVGVEGGKTQSLERPSGGSVELPVPWYFPRSFYLLASMNSVDRAVAPLDSAIGRRFERIEIGPDLDLLAYWLQIDQAALVARLANGGALVTLTAEESSWLLLHRTNHFIATTLGREFELGHTYLRSVMTASRSEDRFLRLATIWDRDLFPQLADRFIGRPAELVRFLKVQDPQRPDDYLFRLRTGLLGDDVEQESVVSPIALVDMWANAADAVRGTLRFLSVP